MGGFCLVFFFCLICFLFFSQFSVSHGFGGVSRGVGIQSGSRRGELLLQMEMVMLLLVPDLAQAPVCVAEDLGRVVRAHTRGKRAGGSHDGGGRLVVVAVVPVMIRRAQAEIPKAQVPRQPKIRHGERERGQVVAASPKVVVVVVVPVPAVMVVIQPRLVHARHDGEHLRHFGLELRDFPLSSQQQTCDG